MPVNSFDNYYMSWRPVLPPDSEPKYVALANLLEHDIETGLLLPGTKLPPQRELADFLDINPSTVTRALKCCTEKGLLIGTVGAGTYVAYNTFTNLLAQEDLSPEMIGMHVLVPAAVPQNEIQAILYELIMDPQFSQILQNVHGASMKQKELAADLLSRFSCGIHGDQIVLANGGQNALAAIFSTVFHPGDRIGVDTYVYPGIIGAAKQFGIQLVPIPHADEEMSAERIENAVKNSGIRGLYVMPDYQNPTAHIMTEESRKMIAQIAKKYNLLIIEDGIHSLISDKIRPSIFSMAPEHTIFILSLSKATTTALRVAFLAVPSVYRKVLETGLYNLNLYQSVLLLETAFRLLKDRRLDTIVEKRKSAIRVRNQIINDILCDYDLRGNEFALSRWLVLPPGYSGPPVKTTV